MYVNHPDVIINDAFRRLAYPHPPEWRGAVGIPNMPPGSHSFIIQVGNIPGTNLNHYRLHDAQGNLIFDPAPGPVIENIHNRNVYLFPIRN